MKQFRILIILILVGCSPTTTKFHYADDVEIKSGFFKGCFGSVETYEERHNQLVYRINPALCPRDGSKHTWNIAWILESDLTEGTKTQHDLVKFIFDETHPKKDATELKPNKCFKKR